MTSGKIAVVGSSNTDMILKVPHIPKPGETVTGGEFSTAPGGKGANQAVAAVRAGGRVSFIAKIGHDTFGQDARDAWLKDGIDTSHVFQSEKSPSGVAFIFVDASGENSIGVAPGANSELRPEDIDNAAKTIRDADVVLLQLETPLETVATALKIAFEQGRLTILNPAPARKVDDNLFRYVTILTPNEWEAEMLTGVRVDSEESARKAANHLLSLGPSTVLVTMGSRGVFLATKESMQRIPAFGVRAVDTTAAGDVFNGALAVALAEGQSMLDAVHFASAAAALSVTRLGAQPSAPYREEIEVFLRQSS